MNVDLNKAEVYLLKMTLNNEIVDFDQRLLLLDNGSTYAHAHRKRCELKALVSKINQLEDGL